MKVEYTCWREGDTVLGYLKAYPDYWTRGTGLEDLRAHLLDLWEEFEKGDIPGIRKVDCFEVA